MGPHAFREQDATLRTAGRALGAARDATVMAAALDALAERDGVDEADLDGLREHVAATLEAATADLDRSAEIALSALRRGRTQLANLTRERRHARAPWCPDCAAHAGAAASRAGSRRATRAPLGTCTPSRAIKDLAHARLELLRDVDPVTLGKVRSRARQLSDLLGEDHDLAALRELAPAENAAARSAIDDRRAQLQADAVALGARLFARSPRRLARRVRKSARARTDWPAVAPVSSARRPA